MSGVTFVKLDPPEYGSSEDTRYSVLLDGEEIGRVESHREESWRKHGRVRTGLIGRPRYWRSVGADRQTLWRYHHTRTSAAAEVVKAFKGED